MVLAEGLLKGRVQLEALRTDAKQYMTHQCSKPCEDILKCVATGRTVGDKLSTQRIDIS